MHRQELATWVRSEVDRAVNDRYADVERVFTTAKFDITDVVRAGLIEREHEVSTALADARAAAAQSQKERAERERTDRKVVATSLKLVTTADEILAALLTAASLTAPNTSALTKNPPS